MGLGWSGKLDVCLSFARAGVEYDQVRIASQGGPELFLRRMGQSPITAYDTQGSTTAIQRRQTAVCRLFLELLLDPQPDVRQAAVECLHRLREPTFPAAVAPLSDDPDPGVRRAVQAALAGSAFRTNPAATISPRRA